MRRRRAQLVLLAAAVVVTALVPMLLAYAQLGHVGDPATTSDDRVGATLADGKRTLERTVAETTHAASNTTGPDQHRQVTALAVTRLDSAADAVESVGTDRGVTVDVARNESAARRWARAHCPGGPDRVFDACVASDGVITQTRANTTALVAVAADVSVRGPDGTAHATFVVRGVRGAVADHRTRT